MDRKLPFLFSLALIDLLSFQSPAFGQGCAPLNEQTVTSASSIGLVSSTVPGAELSEAIGYWGDCSAAGTGFPSLSAGGSADLMISVDLIQGRSDSQFGTCGLFQAQWNAQQQLTGGSITIWTHDSQGRPCLPVSDQIAHELGHVLGLANSSCSGRVMGPQIIEDGDPLRRIVGSEECSAVDGRWRTGQESTNTSIDPLKPSCKPYSCTPIVLDLDADGFHFTGLDESVLFDVDADGEEEILSWTAADGREAFLALDRNGNGWIDDGAELFGGATPQSPSIEPNGFNALTSFDRLAAGGNADGFLSEEDAIFPQLRLWLDANHDGFSQPFELTSLEDEGVTAIALTPIVSERRDRYGNRLRWVSRIWFTGGKHRLAATDVIFLVE